MVHKAHWQPKDRKEDMAQDVRDFVQSFDSQSKMESLIKLSYKDLTDLMLSIRSIEQK